MLAGSSHDGYCEDMRRLRPGTGKGLKLILEQKTEVIRWGELYAD